MKPTSRSAARPSTHLRIAVGLFAEPFRLPSSADRRRVAAYTKRPRREHRSNKGVPGSKLHVLKLPNRPGSLLFSRAIPAKLSFWRARSGLGAAATLFAAAEIFIARAPHLAGRVARLIGCDMRCRETCPFEDHLKAMPLLVPFRRASLAIARLITGWRVSRLPAEAQAGVLTKPVSRRGSNWPFVENAGELVLVSGRALGFRPPAGRIYPLNLDGVVRTVTAPSNRAWFPLEQALRPGITAEQIEVFVRRVAGPALPTTKRHWRLQL